MVNPRRAAARWAQSVAHRFGYDIQYARETADLDRRAKLLETRGITVVLDVGAARGAYAAQLRVAGYRGRIVSFEPLAGAFGRLERAAADDPGWEVRHHALGAEDGEVAINVAGNQDSSSFLEMGARHLAAAPQAAYRKTETVEVRRLDGVWGEVVREGERPFMKLDVQGYELEALRGAGDRLELLDGVQVELSLAPLYEDAPGYREVMDFLDDRGFRLVGLEPGFEDHETGELLQADGTFVRA